MTETDADSESEIKLTTDEIDGNESEIIPNITVMVDVSSNNTEIENVVDLSNQQYTLVNPMYTLGGMTYDLPPHPYLELAVRRGPTGFMSTSHNRYYFANGTFSSARLPNRKRTDMGIMRRLQIHVLMDISLLLMDKECDLTMIRVVKD